MAVLNRCNYALPAAGAPGRSLKLIEELERKRERPRENLAERTLNELCLRDLTFEEGWLKAVDREEWRKTRERRQH